MYEDMLKEYIMPATTLEPEVKKSPSWNDFTLEEHLRAWIGSKPGCIVQAKKIHRNTYRVNLIAPDGFRDSRLVKVISTPEGYIFEDITVRGRMTRA